MERERERERETHTKRRSGDEEHELSDATKTTSEPKNSFC